VPRQNQRACRSRHFQLMTLGLAGFGGASAFLQPHLAGRKTMTPGEVTACIRRLSWSGRFLQGDEESLRRPEHLFVQPVVLGVASGSYQKPLPHQTRGRAIRHTLPQPGGLPFSSPPRRARFLGGRILLVRTSSKLVVTCLKKIKRNIL